MPGTYQGGAYPLPSRCWLCGRYVTGNRDYGLRRCERCDVSWTERLPGYQGAMVPGLEGMQLLLSAKWPLRRHAEYADQFDLLIDHAVVNISCPA
jgi:hypothetical protein